MGIRDADLVATVCPHLGCKVQDPRGKAEVGKEESPAKPKSAFSSTFTKATLETELRIGAAGPDGDLPLSKQDQKVVEELKELQTEIAAMKDIRLRSLMKDPSSIEFKAEIAEREAQVLKLKKTLPVQEAQQARDAAVSMNALAELETKRAQEREQIEAKIDKTLNRQVEVVANGGKEKKSLDDHIAN